jgi:hypothetical protein
MRCNMAYPATEQPAASLLRGPFIMQKSRRNRTRILQKKNNPFLTKKVAENRKKISHILKRTLNISSVERCHASPTYSSASVKSQENFYHAASQSPEKTRIQFFVCKSWEKLTSPSQMGISLHLHCNDAAVDWPGRKQKEFVAKANPCAWTTLAVCSRTCNVVLERWQTRFGKRSYACVVSISVTKPIECFNFNFHAKIIMHCHPHQSTVVSISACRSSDELSCNGLLDVK